MTRKDFLGDAPSCTGDECLEWEGRTHLGYGYLRFGGKVWRAHRLAYHMWVGHIPERALVCHHCDNRKCCRPDHLFVGDNHTNMRDARDKGRLKSNLPADQRGERHGAAKLTEQDVEELKRLRAIGISWSDLGRNYGVHRTTAQRAGEGKRWAHLA